MNIDESISKFGVDASLFTPEQLKIFTELMHEIPYGKAWWIIEDKPKVRKYKPPTHLPLRPDRRENKTP